MIKCSQYFDDQIHETCTTCGGSEVKEGCSHTFAIGGGGVRGGEYTS